MILSFLEKNGIKYEIEKSYENLRDIGKLKFDVYIPSWNLLIEFDGKQHFSAKSSWEKKAPLLDRIKKDIIKDQYTVDNGLSLIRIPYIEEDNINTIMECLVLCMPNQKQIIYTYDHYIKLLQIKDPEMKEIYTVKCPPVVF